MILHLTEEEIALFVERKCDEIEAARIYVHLCRCKSCDAEYQFVSRWRGIWIADREVFGPSQDMIDSGMSVARASAPGSGNYGGAWGRFWRSFFRPAAPRWAAAAAGLTIALAATLWFLDFRPAGNSPIAPEYVRPIRAAAEKVSQRASIVFPGCENALGGSEYAYRSGFVVGDDSLSASLLYLVNRFEDGQIPRDAACLLVTGFLAAGQIAEAYDYAQDALLRFPENQELVILGALVSYCRGDLDRSERLLRESLESDPDNPVALLNLGVVVMDRGDKQEARVIFERIGREYPDSPLVHRVQTLLSTN